MGLRSLCLVVVFAFAAGASASFDLMLLQAQNVESGELGPRVHRYDPINGLHLGSFQIGALAAGMAASAATGELYTMDINGGFRAFSYSTGERLRIAQTTVSGITDLAVNPVDGRIFVANGTSSVYSVNRLTGAITIIASRAGATYVKLGVSNFGSGNLFAINSTGNTLDRFVGSPTVYSYQSSVGTAGTGTYGQLAVGTQAIGGNPTINYARQTSAGFHFTSSPDLPGGGFSVSYTNHADYRATTSAHDGYYVIGNDAVTGGATRVTGVDGLGYYTLSRSVTGISGGVRNVAVVLAPEPGSLAAVGIGLIVLMRRSKRQR